MRTCEACDGILDGKHYLQRSIQLRNEALELALVIVPASIGLAGRQWRFLSTRIPVPRYADAVPNILLARALTFALESGRIPMGPDDPETLTLTTNEDSTHKWVQEKVNAAGCGSFVNS